MTGSLDTALAAEAERIIAGLRGTTTMRVVPSRAHHRQGGAGAGDPLDGMDELLATGLPPADTRVPVTSFGAVLLNTAGWIVPARCLVQ